MQRIYNSKIQGLSLAETLITLTIIAILTAAVIPSLRNTMIQSKVADMLQAVDSIKKNIEDQVATRETLTGISSYIVTPSATMGSNISNLTVSANGIITIIGNSSVDSLTLVLTPTYSTTQRRISWTCLVSNTAHNNLVPRACKNI